MSYYYCQLVLAAVYVVFGLAILAELHISALQSTYRMEMRAFNIILWVAFLVVFILSMTCYANPDCTDGFDFGL